MFKKVHLRLTILCGSITAVILLAMSFGYLYISEQSLKNSTFASFQNSMSTLLAGMEHQNVITHEWLTKMEGNGRYLIHITDNGIPFLYNERETEEQKQLFEDVWRIYENSPGPLEGSEYSDTSHMEFFYTPPRRQKTGSSTDSEGSVLTSLRGFSFLHKTKSYCACTAVSERNGGTLQIIILSPLDTLQAQIDRQRFLFLLLDVAAIVLLSFFSWHFTRRILKPLKENQERQARFVASASHELRTPLAVILSCASASEKAAGEERIRFLEAIHSEGMRMSRLIDDMLLLSTAASGSWSIEQTPVELDTLVLNLFEAFEPVAAKKNITLSVSLPEASLPAVSCDRERITQVLAILLHNAVSYTPMGGRVRLLLTCNGKGTQISVEDNGPGIPDAEKEQIFERFYRAEKSRTEKGHFGLGLCIACEIVHAHHGKISVSDTPGGGSTFTVSLP